MLWGDNYADSVGFEIPAGELKEKSFKKQKLTPIVAKKDIGKDTTVANNDNGGDEKSIFSFLK